MEWDNGENWSELTAVRVNLYGEIDLLPVEFFKTVSDNDSLGLSSLDLRKRGLDEVEVLVIEDNDDDGSSSRVVWVDQSERPVLKLSGGEGLSVDVGQLLQLESPLLGDSGARSLSEADDRVLLVELLGGNLALLLNIVDSLSHG